MKSVHLPFRQVNQNYKRKPFKRLWKSTYDLRVQKIYENSWGNKNGFIYNTSNWNLVLCLNMKLQQKYIWTVSQ